ncbi:MAG: hypothetical protein LBG52_09335 [Candidatus Peribacteria bacterium]|jgi:hypothetical protein|nr:hypothetical protein [Candidatus Peribacteria bacterium]
MQTEKKLDKMAIVRNIVIGLLFIAGIIRLRNDITARENSSDTTTYHIHWIVAFLYNHLGKIVMFCVLGIIPLIFFITARTGRYVEGTTTDKE